MEQWCLWMKHFPFIQPYYAVKCNPDPTLLRWLARRGVSFDCASAREMYMVQEHFGKQPMGHHVLFANPCKTPNDIVVAKELQIPWVTADSVEELIKMDQAGYRPEVLLRVAVDDSSSACPFSEKFGLPPEALPEVALAAKSFHIPVVGLSFHVGSGSQNPQAYGAAIEQSSLAWKQLREKGLVDFMKVMDIGGGWSADRKVFAEQAHHAKEALKQGPFCKKIIAEPGRFFAAPTHTLQVRVVGKKPRRGGGWRYTLDESLQGQFSCIPFDHATPRIGRLRLNPQEPERPRTKASLFGRTCDSLDWIANSESMEELEVGDWLYIPDMGAQTTATSTEFNGFPKPDVQEEFNDVDESDLPVRWLTGLQYPFAKSLSVATAAAELR